MNRPAAAATSAPRSCLRISVGAAGPFTGPHALHEHYREALTCATAQHQLAGGGAPPPVHSACWGSCSRVRPALRSLATCRTRSHPCNATTHATAPTCCPPSLATSTATAPSEGPRSTCTSTPTPCCNASNEPNDCSPSICTRPAPAAELHLALRVSTLLATSNEPRRDQTRAETPARGDAAPAARGTHHRDSTNHRKSGPTSSPAWSARSATSPGSTEGHGLASATRSRFRAGWFSHRASHLVAPISSLRTFPLPQEGRPPSRTLGSSSPRRAPASRGRRAARLA